MEKRINLIPTEMAVPARAVKTAKVISKISTIVVIVLIITSLAIGGIIFYLSTTQSNISSSVESLKSIILSLERNEQKLVLAKDRIEKINIVQDAKSVDDEVSRYQKFTDIIYNSTGSAITQANLSSKGTEVSLVSENSTSLAQIFNPISKLLDYKSIILTSLGYNPSSGFVSSILMKYEE